MRVLYILHSALMGGATIAAINLVSDLEVLGIEPIIIVPKNGRRIDNEALIAEIKRRGWAYEETVVNALTGPYRPHNYLKNAYRGVRRKVFHKLSNYQLESIVQRYKPDIIHTNVGVVQEGYQISRKYGIPHVWHIREYQDRDFSYRFIPSKKAVMEYYSDSNTVCITKDIQGYFGLRECKTSRVIYDPLFYISDVPKFPQIKEDFFLVANRLSPEKGVGEIIEGFAGLVERLPVDQKERYKLIIAGEGNENYTNSLKLLCRTYKIENHVNFIGFQKDVKPFMKKARALLVGSYSEGFGMMTAEANMMGCSVIGRNSAGTREIIDLTSGGILFDTKDDLVDAFVEMAKTPSEEICKNMEIPMRKATELFNRERSAESIFSYYLDILQRK